MPYLIKIGQTVAEISRFNGFQNGGRRHLGFVRRTLGTTHDDHLVVSIVVQNLVEIDAVISIRRR